MRNEGRNKKSWIACTTESKAIKLEPYLLECKHPHSSKMMADERKYIYYIFKMPLSVANPRMEISSASRILVLFG